MIPLGVHSITGGRFIVMGELPSSACTWYCTDFGLMFAQRYGSLKEVGAATKSGSSLQGVLTKRITRSKG